MFHTLLKPFAIARIAHRCLRLPLEVNHMQIRLKTKSFSAKDVFTNNEINVYKNLFESMDKDKDGFLTKEELKKGLKDFANHSATDQELQDALEILDPDKSGSIGFDEFIGYVAWTRRIKLEDAVRSAFETVDKNGDGLIDKEEVRKAIGILGIKTLSESGLHGVMKAFDQDKDGKITLDEFRSFFYETSAKEQ